jgi:hypothetical protein
VTVTLLATRRPSLIALLSEVMKPLLLVSFLLLWEPPSAAGAQLPSAQHDPAAALIVTSDIANFWRAFDRAQHAATADARVGAYLELYLRPGSPGLHDWVQSRLSSGYGLVELLVSKGWSATRLASGERLTEAERTRLTDDTVGVGDRLPAMNLDAAVQHRLHFFSAIRANTLALDTANAIKDSIRTYYRRLAALDPDAVFPPVYFVIGQFNSGGTTGPSGQLIGTEMHGADASTPLDELSSWERGGVGKIDGLPGIVTHELMHTQQAHAQDRIDGGSGSSKPTLLAQSLEEGCASFLASTVMGRKFEADASPYGLAHEHDLWVEFQRDMNGTDASRWLYQGDRAKDRPADLGYFMGARICGAYYQHAADKRQAIRDIFAMPDPPAFLARSGYAP